MVIQPVVLMEILINKLQSNLFITDTKGTGISVRIKEMSVLER